MNDCKAKVAIVEDTGFLERFLKVRAALPTPVFIARPIPKYLPAVAPAPAPTLPSETGPAVAFAAAR